MRPYSNVFLKLAHRASIQGIKRTVKGLEEYLLDYFFKKICSRKKHENIKNSSFSEAF